jgi:fatty-acyl-CoA synthase
MTHSNVEKVGRFGGVLADDREAHGRGVGPSSVNRPDVTIVGRVQDMIVSGGFNVFPSEIENALASHDAVRAAVVLGGPHENGGEAVRAVVELHPGAIASAEGFVDLLQQLKGSVYAPKSVAFAQRPRTQAAFRTSRTAGMTEARS